MAFLCYLYFLYFDLLAVSCKGKSCYTSNVVVKGLICSLIAHIHPVCLQHSQSRSIRNNASTHWFLDDMFQIFLGTTKQLHNLWNYMNKIHPLVKFILQHTKPDYEQKEHHCDCKRENSVPYLDTFCSIKNGRIILDIYRKPTDWNRYLMPDSCHPNSNI